ncbi:MAG: hypothetical protein R2745_11145 [Vicinamibacterales bacterium]
MPRQPKEFQGFSRLTDRLLAVPRETLEKRIQQHREQRTGGEAERKAEAELTEG